MDLGKSVLGALVGGGLGLGAHVGLESVIGEASWFPVITGLLTGLGVRKLDPSVANSASYLRGAMAALVSLGGIFGGIQVASNMEVSRADNLEKPADIVASGKLDEQEDEKAEGGDEEPADEPTDGTTEEEATEEAGTEDEATDGAEEAKPEPRATPARDLSTVTGPTKAPRQDFSMLNFIVIGLGVFLAYEFARGNNPSGGEGSGEEPAGDAPADAEPPAEG